MKVVVAAIIDEQQRFLITRRPLHVPHGGYWEFPGGKVEDEELLENALIREIKEEVGLEVNRYHLLGEVNYQYPGKAITLIIFLVTQFIGNPSCLEGQLAMKWASISELNPNDFPEANCEIIAILDNYLKNHFMRKF